MPSLRPLEHLLGNWRQPDFWLRSSCSLVAFIALVQVAWFGHGRDQSIYAVVGSGMLRGEMPYLDLWDFKPPGIFFFYALAEAVFGRVMWGIRLFECAGLLLLFVVSIRLSRTFFADDRPGFLGGTIAVLVHAQLEFWHTGQPETFGGYLTVLGLWLCTLNPRRRVVEYVAWFFCGAAFGAAFLLKPPLGGGALVCAVYVMINRLDTRAQRRDALWAPVLMGLGAALPIALTVAWFFMRGAWPALAWTLFDFTPGYTKLGWNDNAPGAYYQAVVQVFASSSALVAVGSVAAAVGAPTATREREGLALLLGIIAVQLSGIAMQAKFFAYHFDATLMLVALVAGLGWFKIWRKAMTRGSGGAVAFASLLFLIAVARTPVNDIPHGFWQRVVLRTELLVGRAYPSQEQMNRDLYRAADFDLGANIDVARRVRELTTDEEPIYVWGFEPSVYWFSERTPSSRFIYNVPQRAQWDRDRARTMLMADLARRPPRVFVVQHDDYFKFVTGNDHDSFRALGDFPELDTLLRRNYRHVERLQDFEIFVREGP